MAKKKVVEEDLKALKVKLQEGKAVIGTEVALKGIKNGTLRKVFLSSNCPQKVREDISYYAQLASIPVVELKYTNEELGIFCKKNFLVSVLGVTEE